MILAVTYDEFRVLFNIWVAQEMFEIKQAVSEKLVSLDAGHNKKGIRVECYHQAKKTSSLQPSV